MSLIVALTLVRHSNPTPLHILFGWIAAGGVYAGFLCFMSNPTLPERSSLVFRSLRIGAAFGVLYFSLSWIPAFLYILVQGHKRGAILLWPRILAGIVGVPLVLGALVGALGGVLCALFLVWKNR